MNNPLALHNNHRKRATNLPGAAGGNFVPNRKRRSPPMLAAKPAAAPVPTMPPTHDAPEHTTVAAVAQTSPNNGVEFQADLNALHDRMQWVYGTVAVDLVGARRSLRDRECWVRESFYVPHGHKCGKRAPYTCT